MKEKLIAAIREYFNNLDRASGGECNESHCFDETVIEIIEKVFEGEQNV